jgi:hypothetical protein
MQMLVAGQVGADDDEMHRSVVDHLELTHPSVDGRLAVVAADFSTWCRDGVIAS